MTFTDLGAYVKESARQGRLVVQPRMGMAGPREMAAGLRAVAAADARTVATLTLDSYTRVGDHDGARRALAAGEPLNGFPLVAHGARLSAEVAAAAYPVPVQVRHGSAVPGDIFTTMADAGLTASEGGPVSYCLPYGRTPLAESVAAWRDATTLLAERTRANGARAHLETFGGCLLGQLCPPSLLVAMSVLEALFFTQHDVDSVSLSYAQQTHLVQDVEALAALRLLADELLPPHVDWHIVLYTYMGVYPRSTPGAQLLLDSSAELAVRGGAERMIVKTVAESHRIPTVDENVAALHSSARRAEEAPGESGLPWSRQVDPTAILAETRALIAPVLEYGDVGDGMLAAFRAGLLDVPFCLHADNRGLTQSAIGKDGRLHWARTGGMPLPTPDRVTGRLRSVELLHMLNLTARRHDELALESVKMNAIAPPVERKPRRIAVVGVGPRGLSVLERLAARLAEEDDPRTPVEIYAIDAHEPGPGRVWRPEQPQWLLMNTPAGEVTMFSGPADSSAARPGAGPSLAEWWNRDEPGIGGPYAYAPRGTYGRYLRFVLDAVERGLPDHARLHRVRAQVHGMRRAAGNRGWELSLAEGTQLSADRVVLTTGHPFRGLTPDQQELADFATTRPGLTYVRGDSAADMPLDGLPAGATVGILGLGLAFYDVMALLTEGRGGRYEPVGDGLRYVPSGCEPRLVAGSRSGVPLPARGLNQKQATRVYHPRLFTRQRVAALRSTGKIDFSRQLLPWLMAEVNLVHHTTEIRGRLGARTAELFVEQAVQAALGDDTTPDLAVVRQAGRFGAHDPRPVDLATLSRPFTGRHFPDRAAYREAVVEHIRTDLAESAKGNVDGPIKASLDTLRDVRSVIRTAVDLSGLTARSYEQDFLGTFVPLSSHLSAGPPSVRLRQVLALVEAGVLELAGPDVQFGVDVAAGRFTVRSPHVDQRPLPLDALIDARIPAPDVRADTSPLVSGLLRDGVITSYANVDDASVLDTGGLAVTASPFHPVDSNGAVVHDLYALGIPTEHARWFTQVGSGRPGTWGEFTGDADAIATDMVAGLRTDVSERQETSA